jgi:hypothetical protein
LDGRFKIEKVFYVEQSDDGITIFEFSNKTVDDLKDAGYKGSR